MGRLMPGIMRLRRSNKNHRTRDRVQSYLDYRVRNPEPSDPPRQPQKDVSISESAEHGWRVFTVSPTGAEAHGTVVYLHGGGWMNEAVSQHWKLVQQIAAEASVKVILPAYPLVQAGGTAETVVPIVSRISERVEGPLVLMGDSAGGTIAMSTSFLLKERGRPADLTVLIAPALDMRMQNPEMDEIQPLDPWLVKKGQLLLTEMWIGENGNDPILNPFLGNTRGAGKILVFSGTRDLLNPDTRIFVRNAITAGGDVDYYEQDGHLHVYPLLPTPEGKQARNAIVNAVRRTTETR
ncbi:alpha/beta hydrolase fold domain-containing protein [Brachybacterium sacelli]|uniref:Acetyl esterase/lipase n=1 Tax=Brachybacterium sacelli TaxID=173364 RepID=A0ABS4X7U1_9MICO|nr:alpha/beta hydrolase [Brachybacterium sacelli]MBP2383784.1 acetyl esterase/lipase [Brachybacterium sacelli]